MTRQHPHIKTLRQHNKWRRGELDVQMVDPAGLGIAMDWAIKVCELAQRFIEARPNESGEWYERLESEVKHDLP